MALKKILEEVNSPLKNQLETLCDVIDTLQNKLIENEAKYKTEPLSVEIQKQDGQITYRTNPFLEEYRATVRDYAQALTKLKELCKNDIAAIEVDNLNDLRTKFKIRLE